jgi:hypothetical protein
MDGHFTLEASADKVDGNDGENEKKNGGPVETNRR